MEVKINIKCKVEEQIIGSLNEIKRRIIDNEEIKGFYVDSESSFVFEVIE